MRRWMVTGAATLVLLLAGCGGDEGNVAAPPGGEKIAPIAAPAGTEWTQVASETPDGGFLMGNPNAPVKLVEYASFGCPHCAAFEEEGGATMEELVKSGRVSWEFRSFLLFPADPGLTMLTRCHGPDAFFLLKTQLYANQQDWVTKMQAAAASIEALPQEQRTKPLIEAGGIDQFFRQRGMPQARIDSCLADKAGLDRALAVSKRGAEELNVQGTPTFFINGVLLSNTSSWSALEPQLKRALGE